MPRQRGRERYRQYAGSFSHHSFDDFRGEIIVTSKHERGEYLRGGMFLLGKKSFKSKCDGSKVGGDKILQAIRGCVLNKVIV
jgi:hypothetical protein